MKLSMPWCQQTSHVLDAPPIRLKMDIMAPRWQKQKKVLVLMGATGSGKSRLSIDLATQFPAEIINSDKMQIYEGLDIVTNKITEEERARIPHHLLGIADPNKEFTATNFGHMASQATDSILSRGLHPIIVGGSNSYIETLMDAGEFRFRSKYDCFFLWVDVAMPVLDEFISKRVDQMINNGMIDEVRSMFDPTADYSRGIWKSIGVPEFDNFFQNEKFLDEQDRARILDRAICDIKNNTRKLARRQLDKIHRLRNMKGWNIHRIDATQVFRSRGKESSDKAWEKFVARPSLAIVTQFLENATTNGPSNFGTTLDKYLARCLVA